MKRIVFFFLTAFYASSVFSQLYQLDFESNSATDTLDSVQVINLSSNDTLFFIFTYTSTTAIEKTVSDVAGMGVYPNPSYGELVIEPGISSGQSAIIRITDLSGRVVFTEQLKTTGNENLIVSNIPKGMYVLSIVSSEKQYSEPIISQSKINGWSGVTTSYASGTKTTIDNATVNYNLKSSMTSDTTIACGDSTMLYNEGERLLLTGYSGTMQTVISFIPTNDTTISFNFYACTDGDNNKYKVVEIVNQIWMAENLKTTKYNDDTSISLETDNTAWSNLGTPGYCWYNNDQATCGDSYGALYNWYTVNAGKLCPTGWHVPTDAEWTILIDYFGGSLIAGDKLKEAGTTHWASPNTGATNETGFTALPGGYRYDNGTFDAIGFDGFWWSASESNTDNAWSRGMGNDQSSVYRGPLNKKHGFSVRCVRD
jgi:uncharacterized protein (TIGR02145 family)